MTEQVVAARGVNAPSDINTIAGKAVAAATSLPQRYRRSPHRRLCRITASQSNSVTLTSSNCNSPHLPVEMDSADASRSNSNKEKELRRDVQATKHTPSLQYGIIGGKKISSSMKASQSSSAPFKNNIAYKAEKQGKYEAPWKPVVVQPFPPRNSAKPKKLARPRMVAEAAVASLAKVNHGFLCPEYAKDLFSSSSSFANDSMEGKRDTISYNDVDADTSVHVPSQPSLPVISNERRQAVNHAYQTYRESVRSTAAASAKAAFVAFLREVCAIACEKANTTASDAVISMPSATELLHRAEMYLGKDHFCELMSAVDGDAAAAACAPFTAEDALCFSSAFSSGFASTLLENSNIAKHTAGSNPQQNMESLMTTRRKGSNGNNAANAPNSARSPSTNMPPSPPPPLTARQQTPPPKVPKSPLPAKASFSSVLDASHSSSLSPAVTFSKPSNPLPHFATTTSSASASAEASGTVAATPTHLLPPISETNCAGPILFPRFGPSKVGRTKNSPLARRGAGAARRRKPTPLTPNNICRNSSSSAFYNDVAVLMYVVHKAFAELADGQCCISFERLSEAFRLFELCLNPAAVAHVCNTAGDQIDLSAFEKIAEAGLQHSLDADQRSNETRKCDRKNETAGEEENPFPAMFHLVTAHTVGGACTPTRSGDGEYVGGISGGNSPPRRNFGGSGSSVRDSLLLSKSGVPSSGSPYRSICHSRSISSPTASVASVPLSCSHSDDAYPVIVAQDSAVAALCREIRWRLRNAAHLIANDSAKSKSHQTGSQFCGAPPLPPPSPALTPFKTYPTMVSAAVASLLTPLLVARQRSASATASSPSFVNLAFPSCDPHLSGKFSSEVRRTSSSSVSCRSFPRMSSRDSQKNQCAPSPWSFLSTQRLSSNANVQQQKYQQHQCRSYRNAKPKQQPPRLSTLQTVQSRETFQQWQRETVSPATVLSWTAPHPYGPAMTTAGQMTVHNTTRNNNTTNVVHDRVGGCAVMKPSQPRSAQTQRRPSLGRRGTTQGMSARCPGTNTSRAIGMAYKPVQPHPSSSSSPATTNAKRRPRRRAPRWELVTALSPYYVSHSEAPPQESSGGIPKGMQIPLTGTVQVPWQRLLFSNENCLRSLANKSSPSPPRPSHGLILGSPLTDGTPSSVLQPHRPFSASPLKRNSQTHSSSHAAATVAVADSPTTLAVSHPLRRFTQSFASKAIAVPSSVFSSLQQPPKRSQQLQQQVGQQYNVLREQQNDEKEQHLRSQTDEAPLSTSHVTLNDTNRSNDFSSVSRSFFPQHQLRREWVLHELASLYAKHNALTERLAALSSAVAAPSLNSVLPTQQSREQEAVACEVALNNASRLIHRYLAELAVGNIAADNHVGTNHASLSNAEAQRNGKGQEMTEEEKSRRREEHLAYAATEARQAALGVALQVACSSTPLSQNVTHDLSRPPRVLIQHDTATLVAEQGKSEVPHALVGSSQHERGVPVMFPSSESDLTSNAKSNSDNAGGEGERFTDPPSTPSRDSNPFSGPASGDPQQREFGSDNSNHNSALFPYYIQSSAALSGSGSVNNQLAQRSHLPVMLAANEGGAGSVPPEPLLLPEVCRFGQSPNAADSSTLLIATDASTRAMAHSSCEQSASEHPKISQTSTLLLEVGMAATDKVAAATAPLPSAHASHTQEHNSAPATLSNTLAGLSFPPTWLQTLAYNSQTVQLRGNSNNTGPTVPMSPPSASVAAAAAAMGPHGSAATLSATAIRSAQPSNTTAAAMREAVMHDDDSPSPRANIYLEWAVMQLKKRQVYQQQQRLQRSGISSSSDSPSRINNSSSLNARVKDLKLTTSSITNSVCNTYTPPSPSASYPSTTTTTLANTSSTQPRVFGGNVLCARRQMNASCSGANGSRALTNWLNISKQSSGGSEAGLPSILAEQQSPSICAPLIVDNEGVLYNDRPFHGPSSISSFADGSPPFGSLAGDRAALLHRNTARAANSRSNTGDLTPGHLTNISLESNLTSQVSGISAPLEFFGSATWSAVAQNRTGAPMLRSRHGSTMHRTTSSESCPYGGADNQRSYSAFERTVSSTLAAGFSGSMFTARDVDANLMYNGDA